MDEGEDDAEKIIKLIVVCYTIVIHIIKLIVVSYTALSFIL
jgi:hypothetical protein